MRPILPIMGVVFVAFMVIGLAMPVLPLHVHDGLGLSTFVVGLVAGSQFTASLLSRFWAGRYADHSGAKRAVVGGLVAAAIAGLLYLLSLRFVAQPKTAVTILLVGRGLLGGAESFIITGALSWALALGGRARAGKVIAWVGMAMFGAFAVGAPAGTALYSSSGFSAIALATTLMPVATLLLVMPLRPIAPSPHAQPALQTVARAVTLPGLGLALASVGFGSVTTFIGLDYAKKGWSPAWLAFTGLSAAFIAGRLTLGHLPDKIGGARVALVSVLIEAAGQALIWLAPSSAVALGGVVLSGLGYSLVYPALGVEAIRRAPPESRGLVMGVYSAFLDLALGLANPALGLVAGAAGLGAVFLTSAMVVACSAAISARLLQPQAQWKTAPARSG